MATYVVTTANWNSSAFWSSISTVSGDTLDFSALPANFTVQFDAMLGRVTISDGSTSYVVGQPGAPGTNSNLAAGALSDFLTIFGSQGDDRIVSGNGNDTIDGGDGNDLIFSDSGDDSITGGAGDDTLWGGFGADTIEGGAGNDYFWITDTDDADVISDSSGYDGLVFANDLTNQGVDLEFSGSGSGNWIYFDPTATSSGTFTGIEQVIGSENNDSITSFSSFTFQQLFGREGNDTLVSGQVGDELFGELGDDSLQGFGGDDTIDGGSGNDTVFGGDGADSIVGGTGNDRLDGDNATGGDDSIFAGDGDDTLIGDAGNDRLQGDAGNDSIFAGDGNDTANGGADTDRIFGEGGDDELFGGAGNDSVYGDAGNDVIWGDAGNDLLEGGDGSDDIQVRDGDGIDTIVGGEGGATDNDRLVLSDTGATGVSVTVTGAEEGDYAFISGFGIGSFREVESVLLTNQSDIFDGSADTLGMGAAGFGGDDLLIGGSGNDTMQGDQGQDVFWLGGGTDLISGGDDADQIVVEDGFNGSGLYGGEGTTTGVDRDVVDLTNMSSGANVSFSGAERGEITSGADSATFFEMEAFLLSQQSDLFDGRGSSTATEAFGNGGEDTLIGSSQSDTLIGGDGQDTLRGGSGVDSLEGGAGDDLIEGGADGDVIRGDTGNDTLDYSGSDAAVTIDLSTQTSNEISPGVFAAVGSGGHAAGDTVRGMDNLIGSAFNDALTLNNSPDTTTAIGGAGDDTITGALNDNVLTGDAGDDMIIAGAGSDTVTGGDGNDSLLGEDGDDSLLGGLATIPSAAVTGLTSSRAAMGLTFL